MFKISIQKEKTLKLYRKNCTMKKKKLEDMFLELNIDI